MIHLCCRSCRLRFAPAAAPNLAACPECGRAPHAIAGAEGVVGFRLFTLEDLPYELPEAIAVPLPDPSEAPGPGRR